MKKNCCAQITDLIIIHEIDLNIIIYIFYILNSNKTFKTENRMLWDLLDLHNKVARFWA